MIRLRRPFVLFAIALSVSLATPALASLASDTFQDVPKGHWAEQGVAEVAIKRDLMKGYPDGTFRGDRPFTRTQFVDSLVSLLKELETLSKTSWRPAEHPFNAYADVTPGPDRDHLLMIANDYGLFEGVPGITPDRFSPDTPVTRYEMAKIIDNLMRLAEAKDVVRPRGKVGSGPTFSDVSRKDWAYPAVVDVSQRYKVMVGFPDGTFRGPEKLTRYQYAQAISQTVPQIRALIAETGQLKAAEKMSSGPRRYQDLEPYRLELASGVTGGLPANGSGQMSQALSFRYVGYPTPWFVLSDTRLQLQSGALAGLGTSSSAGTSLDESLGLMVQLPMLGPVQVQPYLGLRAYADFAPGESYLFMGPGAGLVTYYRPSASPWGVFLKGGLSSMLLGSQLAGSNPTDPTPSGLVLVTSEAGVEYHVAPQMAITAGLNYWEAPVGYLTGVAPFGKASHTGLALGLQLGF
ncbi:MAG TPA: S-layer homology domain-containing protein [Stenomitos sp.]